MAWVEILPAYQTLFRRLGWDTATPFLEWSGILVNRHRHRQVEQVFLPSPHQGRGAGGAGAEFAGIASPSPPTPLQQGGEGSSGGFFLKKEAAVTWRDRLRNAWHGFGWCSTVVREAALLQSLRQAGIGCPEVAALGEDGRHAFVLTCDESALVDLRTFLPSLATEKDRKQFACALGRELARIHDAGFDHPDLFAKHILAAGDGSAFRFCFLDWQRGRRRRSVSWRTRCRDLATLDATLHFSMASDRLRLCCLRAYGRALTSHERPPLRRLARAIRHLAERLLTNRNLREIGGLPVPAEEQQFVSLEQGRWLVVKSFYDQCRGQMPDWMTPRFRFEVQARNGFTLACASGTELAAYSWPRAGTSVEMPPLAHTLFRLQRFGVSAPRLLAVGFSESRVTVIATRPATRPFAEALAKAPFTLRCQLLQQAGWIIRQIHEAGYHLPEDASWLRRLGAGPVSATVVLTQVEPITRSTIAWQELAPLDFNRPSIRLSRTEQLRFLRGYLQRSRLNKHDRAWMKTLLAPGIRSRERQASHEST